MFLKILMTASCICVVYSDTGAQPKEKCVPSDQAQRTLDPKYSNETSSNVTIQTPDWLKKKIAEMCTGDLKDDYITAGLSDKIKSKPCASRIWMTWDLNRSDSQDKALYIYKGGCKAG